MRRRYQVLLGLALVVASGIAVLAAEVVYVRQKSYLGAADAPIVAGSYGSGAPLRLTLAGDSTAAGVGATSTDTSVGGRLAAAVAAATGRQVLLSSVAVSGSRARDLVGQASTALAQRPDVVVVLIGANDATNRTDADSMARDLGAALMALRSERARVIVGTCPDMGATPAFPQPLRALSGWQGRRVAAAQVPVVTAADAVPVPLAKLTGPAFRSDPDLFAADEFHPDDDGYEVWAEALLPEVLEAAGRASSR